jgi:hypothetical protein
MSKSHIDAVLSCPNVGVQQWILTGFYSEPRSELRRNNWYLLRFLCAQLDIPWLCLGDFNKVLDGSEHFGANEMDCQQMEAFQQVAEDCRFVDLGFSGLPYTWDNRQGADRNVKVQLDRAFGDFNFMEVLRDTAVRHVPMTECDHCALVCEVKKHRPVRRRQRQRCKRVFRYDNMWQRHEAYMEFVQQA